MVLLFYLLKIIYAKRDGSDLLPQLWRKYAAMPCSPDVLVPCYKARLIYLRHNYHPRLYQYYINQSFESMIIPGTAIKPVLFLIPEFILAAHGLKLIEKIKLQES